MKVEPQDYRDYFSIIQNIIERMAKNSFTLKGWLLTLFAGMIAINLNVLSALIFLCGIILTLFFWGLDSYYLWQERLFRALWEKKVEELNDGKDIKIYDLKINPANLDIPYWKTLLSKTELMYYLPILSICILIFIIML